MRILSASSTKRAFGLPLLRRAALAAAAFLLIASALFPSAASAAAGKKFASVNVSKLYLRQKASVSARVVCTLSRGQVVRVTSSGKIWCQVEASSGKTGWCQTRYLGQEADASSFKPSASALLDWPSEWLDLSKPPTYQRCMQAMNDIVAAYPDLARIENIGTSVMGNSIDAIVLGNPDAGTKILVQATIHARESIASFLALRQAECMLKAAENGGVYKSTKVSDLLNNVEIWIVPMSNPDGVRLVYEGLSAVPASMPDLAARLKQMNNGSASFYHWKANANGVDLNRNFDANWKPDPKNPKPGSQNYPGPSAFSEPESQALRDLTLKENFALTISYHASGNMLYWYDPNGESVDLNKYIATELKAMTGYTVLPPSAQGPDGGYRDWYVQQYHQPGITLEMGTGYCPLPPGSFGGIWDKCRLALLDMAWIVEPKSLSAYGGS